LSGAEVTVDIARAEIAEMMRFIQQQGDGKLPFLIDIRNIRSITREAREYLASAEASEPLTAVGLLTTSPISRVIGNFFLGLNRPPHPIRMFTSEEEAIAWLRGI
jgi:hypothetical protein